MGDDFGYMNHKGGRGRPGSSGSGRTSDLGMGNGFGGFASSTTDAYSKPSQNNQSGRMTTFAAPGAGLRDNPSRRPGMSAMGSNSVTPGNQWAPSTSAAMNPHANNQLGGPRRGRPGPGGNPPPAQPYHGQDYYQQQQQPAHSVSGVPMTPRHQQGSGMARPGMTPGRRPPPQQQQQQRQAPPPPPDYAVLDVDDDGNDIGPGDGGYQHYDAPGPTPYQPSTPRRLTRPPAPSLKHATGGPHAAAAAAGPSSASPSPPSSDLLSELQALRAQVQQLTDDLNDSSKQFYGLVAGGGDNVVLLYDVIPDNIAVARPQCKSSRGKWLKLSYPRRLVQRTTIDQKVVNSIWLRAYAIKESTGEMMQYWVNSSCPDGSEAFEKFMVYPVSVEAPAS